MLIKTEVDKLLCKVLLFWLEDVLLDVEEVLLDESAEVAGVELLAKVEVVLVVESEIVPLVEVLLTLSIITLLDEISPEKLNEKLSAKC
jgi:hypothetical protein